MHKERKKAEGKAEQIYKTYEIIRKGNWSLKKGKETKKESREKMFA